MLWDLTSQMYLMCLTYLYSVCEYISKTEFKHGKFTDRQSGNLDFNSGSYLLPQLQTRRVNSDSLQGLHADYLLTVPGVVWLGDQSQPSTLVLLQSSLSENDLQTQQGWNWSCTCEEGLGAGGRYRDCQMASICSRWDYASSLNE